MDLFFEEKEIGRVNKLLILAFIPFVFLITGLIYGLFFEGPLSALKGFLSIVLSPTILVTDFLEVGGIAATFINVAIIGFFNIYLMNEFKLKVNGVLIAAFFTLIGFSFFGKNIYNILPIYLGGLLYTKYQKIHFKDIIVVVMFGTALSPLISEINFADIFLPTMATFLAVLIGIFIGFVIVPLSSHMMKFHEGFNLYNIGFTSGIIGTVLTSILRSFGISIEPVSVVSRENQWIIIAILIIIVLVLFFLGLYIQKDAIKNIPSVLVYKGRLVTDFTYFVGYGTSFVNMSILGAFSLAYVYIVGGVLNGPVLAGVFTVMGFGAFGKHLRNTLPVVAGVIVTALILGYDVSSTGIILAVLFSTTLGPIAGTYGIFIGFIAGMLHMFLVTNVGIIHGGINLYNNGFSGGIVAGVLVPVVEAFRKE